MYARCIEMYGDALAEPYKEVSRGGLLGVVLEAVLSCFFESFHLSFLIHCRHTCTTYVNAQVCELDGARQGDPRARTRQVARA